MKILSFSIYSDGRSIYSAYNSTIGRFISAPNPSQGAFALLFPIAILLVVYIRP
jgi:hypothetical protein